MDWQFIICTAAMIILAVVVTWVERPVKTFKEILEYRRSEENK